MMSMLTQKINTDDYEFMNCINGLDDCPTELTKDDLRLASSTLMNKVPGSSSDSKIVALISSDLYFELVEIPNFGCTFRYPVGLKQYPFEVGTIFGIRFVADNFKRLTPKKNASALGNDIYEMVMSIPDQDGLRIKENTIILRCVRKLNGKDTSR